MSVSHGSTDSAPGPLKGGEIFDERYLVKEEIGRGGNAIVYHASQLDLERDVALKCLNKSKLHDSVSVERFLREFRILSDLKHNNIMLVYHVSRSANGTAYAACEYIGGQSLRQVLDQKSSLSWRRALAICIQIAEACFHAHKQGVVHRDLKPENVMLLGEPPDETIKLLDFGLSRVIDERQKDLQRLTATGQVIGTLSYLSPESFYGRVDERADIYSLACILYELLAGQSLFSVDVFPDAIVTNLRDDPTQRFPAIKEAVPEKLLSLLHEMLAKTPDDRTPSMERVLNEMKSIQEAPGKVISAQQWCSMMHAKRNSLPAFLGVALIATFLLLLIVSTALPRAVIDSLAPSHAKKVARPADLRSKFGQVQRSYWRALYKAGGRPSDLDADLSAGFISNLKKQISETEKNNHALLFSLWQLKGWIEYVQLQHYDDALVSFKNAAENAIAVNPDSVEGAQSYMLIGMTYLEMKDVAKALEWAERGIQIFDKYEGTESYRSIEGGTKLSWSDNYRRRVPFDRTWLGSYLGADSMDPNKLYARMLELKGDCDGAISRYLKASANQKRIGEYFGFDTELIAIRVMHRCGRKAEARSSLEKLENFLLQRSQTNLTDTIGNFAQLRVVCVETENPELEKSITAHIHEMIRFAPDPDELKMMLKEANSRFGYTGKEINDP